MRRRYRLQLAGSALVAILVALCSALSAQEKNTDGQPLVQQVPQSDSATPRTGEAPATAVNAADVKQPARAPLAPSPARSVDEVVNRTIDSEHRFLANLRKYTPLVETYIQNVQKDTDFGTAPERDHYFIGRLEFASGRVEDKSYLPKPGIFQRMMKKVATIYSLDFLPLGFAQMVLIDAEHFDREHYN